MESKTFQGDKDRYKGVTVDSLQEPCEDNEFSNTLAASLKKWSDEKKKCIWFKVNIKHAAWVPILAKEGFNFHHSRDNFVMMWKWLPTDRKSNLPPASHTNVGVGGLVLNNNNEILVVIEKHTEFVHWKLPGGYVEKGEDLKNAAIREVKEETGVDTTYESMVTLRHTHNMSFGNSDLYVIIMLRPTTNVITKCATEIAECKWMDVEEFLNHSNVHEFNRFIVNQALDLKQRKLKLSLNPTTLTVGNFSREITSMVLEDAL